MVHMVMKQRACATPAAPLPGTTRIRTPVNQASPVRRYQNKCFGYVCMRMYLLLTTKLMLLITILIFVTITSAIVNINAITAIITLMTTYLSLEELLLLSLLLPRRPTCPGKLAWAWPERASVIELVCLLGVGSRV